MTYYEEFGISSAATAEEIRHAHRRLMKILHPDLQTEDSARQLAEIQTCRVNGIAHTLLNTEERDAYDVSINTPPETRSLTKRSYSPYVYAAAVVFSLTCLWILQPDHLPSEAHQRLEPSGAAQPDPERPSQGIHTQSSTTLNPQIVPEVKSKTNLDPSETAPEVSPQDPPPSLKIDAVRVEPEQNKQAPALPEIAQIPPPKLPPASAPNPPDNPLIGTWIYLPEPLTKDDPKIYRPEYIEMRIRNVRGVLEGQYRARYHVPDRPLSPNVGFSFAGESGTRSTAFRWNGSQGVAGRVELKLMTTNSIQVDWRVTELANLADLVSGSAVLTRVQ